MGLREPSSRGVALEDAAGCPACLSPSLPRGDGDGDGVRNMTPKGKEVGNLRLRLGKEESIAVEATYYSCGCIDLIIECSAFRGDGDGVRKR